MLGNALGTSSGGKGRFVMVAGDAGMGKTRLIAEFADIAERRGSHVLWSQVIEDPGAPPNFPWMLALRSYAQRLDDDTLSKDLGVGAADVATILPELRERLSLGAVPAAGDSATTRYQLYDSVTRFLLNGAARQPLVLLFDNLHAADGSSLAILEYVSHQITRSAVLIVGAYRASELDRRHPLRATLHRLSRNSGYTRLELPGLSRDEVASLLHSKLNQAPSAPLVSSVLAQSGGNPLFVSEVGAMLLRQGSGSQQTGAGVRFQVPNSLRDVIAARLESLSDDTVSLLRIAAIFGMDFEQAALSELASVSATRVMRQLQYAEAAGIISPNARGRFRFSHVLYREVLYAEHNTVARVTLHRRAAEMIERRYADDPEPQLSALAFHYFEAVQAGSEDKAIFYCERAADLAMRQRAYDEATALLDCALQAVQLAEHPDPARRFEMLRALGRAEYRAGELRTSAQTLMKAAILAYRRAWWDRLAEVLCLFQLSCQQTGYHHVASIPLHNAVLENLPDNDRNRRARVLASLAKAYRTAARPGLARETFRQSVTLARECGDPAVLLECLRKGNWTVGRDPGSMREGLEVSREALALAIEQGDTAATLDSIVDLIFQLCDLGELDEVALLLAELAKLAKAERQPHFRILAAGFETAIAILRGEWDRALHSAQEGLKKLPVQDVKGLRGRFAFQIFAINKAQGSLGQLKGIAERIISDSDEANLWLPGKVLLHCELGEFDRAREALQELGEFGSLPNDDLREIALIYLVESCLKLDDRTRCQALYRLLLPYRHLNATLPGTFMLGAVSGYLAELAAVLRRPAEARALFEEALAMNTRMQAAPALARTQVEYARWLMSGDSTDDRERASQLLTDARQAAIELKLDALRQAVDRLEDAGPAERLTGREIDVLRIVARGASNKGIAETLSISHSTVTTHIRNIFRKTGVANRTEAADYARRSGILEQE